MQLTKSHAVRRIQPAYCITVPCLELFQNHRVIVPPLPTHQKQKVEKGRKALKNIKFYCKTSFTDVKKYATRESPVILYKRLKSICIFI